MDNNITRYEVNPEEGLSSYQVDERVSQKLTNVTKRVVGKTYMQIIRDNVLNFFNILLFVIGIFMLIAQKYDSLFFLAILIPNIAIGLYEDIHARKLMDKLSIVTAPSATVIRNGLKETIKSENIVLDDIVELKSGMQICADSVLVSGSLLVNESLLTGESRSISKVVGDEVLSGSFVFSGNALVRVMKVGPDSYVETLQASAQKFKRSPSEILRSLRMMFRVIGIVVIISGIMMVATSIATGMFDNYQNFQTAIGAISGSMVSMIPSGLYLLTSLALATAVINLSKHQARVQDFYSVEMLARTNVLCVDKTGTITDGTMNVFKIVPFGASNEITISSIVGDFAALSEDDNATMNALKKYFTLPSHTQAREKLNFNSDNKYSAITFASGVTYVLGATDCINLVNKAGIMHRVSEYTAHGYRVLVLAKATGGIRNNKVEGICEAIGMVILQDHIKEDAIETFKWFKENNVEIKVISGDDAQTVSEIARQVGIENADRYISLAGMPIEQVKLIAKAYNVFGRVTPEQKEALVIALKEEGNTVAMTGDGVNDILALKRADCSIAMASGSEAAKNVSHIVLLDSNFSHLPNVVAQGRRVINNLQRTGSLFLAKTMFAATLTLIAIITKFFYQDINFPFLTNHLYIWEFAFIGFSSFFLALEPNSERLTGKFLNNILKKATPPAVASILGVIIIFGLYHLNKNGVMYTGIYSRDAAIVMCVIMFTTIAAFTCFKTCLPFNKYRLIVFSVGVFIALCEVGLAVLLDFTAESTIFRLNFHAMNPVNYLVTGIITVMLVTLYLSITYIAEVIRGGHLDVDNKSGSEKRTQEQ